MLGTRILMSRLGAVCAIGMAATVVGCSSDKPTGPGGGGSAVIPPILAWRPSSTTGGATLVTINSNGTNAHTVTTMSTHTGAAQATQAGKLIVFSDATSGGAQGLFTIDQTGTRRALVTPAG